MEIPGQYTNHFEPNQQNHVKVIEVQKELECVNKNRTITRIISIKGSNGKSYHYQISNKAKLNKDHNENLL